jgi:hypothetical protein
VAEYHVDNRDTIRAQRKEHYQTNRETILAREKDYQQANRDKISTRKRERVVCEQCGSNIQRGDLAKHKRTKKHQNSLAI